MTTPPPGPDVSPGPDATPVAGPQPDPSAPPPWPPGPPPGGTQPSGHRPPPAGPGQPPPVAGYAPAPGAYAPPTQPLAPSEERNLAVISHVGVLLGMFTTAVLGPVIALVIYLMYRDRGPFVRAHSANSLNIQIATFLGALISIPLMFVVVGFFTLIFVLLWSLVLHIMGAVRAHEGRFWDPPLVPRFVT